MSGMRKIEALIVHYAPRRIGLPTQMTAAAPAHERR
jgi:hypothetical protein